MDRGWFGVLLIAASSIQALPIEKRYENRKFASSLGFPKFTRELAASMANFGKAVIGKRNFE